MAKKRGFCQLVIIVSFELSFSMSARSRILAQIQAINPWERSDTDYWPRVKTIIGGVLESLP